MATSADFTTRARDEMFSIYRAYQSLRQRVDDMDDEISAMGGPALIYIAGFPEQGDGFDAADMVAAYQALASLIGDPTQAQKDALIRARR